MRLRLVRTKAAAEIAYRSALIRTDALSRAAPIPVGGSCYKGLALDWADYSGGKYGAAQEQAEHAGRRISKGCYVDRVCDPKRRSYRLPTEATLRV